MGGHMLRKFTIARWVETGQIVEDSLAGWNLDPISKVGLVGGIWKYQWIIANQIRDCYFPFITVPLCPGHHDADHFCVSDILSRVCDR